MTTRNNRPVMKDWYQDQGQFAQRLNNALMQEKAFEKAEVEYGQEVKYFEPKDHGLKGDLIKRVAIASQSAHKTWEQKGSEFQKERQEMFAEEKRQQAFRTKATNLWLKEEMKDVNKEEEVAENVI